MSARPVWRERQSRGAGDEPAPRVVATAAQAWTRRQHLATWAAGTLVPVSALLAACGAPGGETTAGGAAGAVKAPAKIRLLGRLPSEEEVFEKRLPVFRQQHPHVTLDVEMVPSGDMITKLQTMAASDTMPDNAHSYLGAQSYHNFATTGAFRSIEDLIARDKFDVKAYFPEIIEIMRIDGKLHGLPFKGQILAGALFYNVTLFEKRGVALPTDSWSLDDLVKAAQQLTERQGSETTQWGYALASWAGENLTGHLRAFNGDTYSKDGKKATLDTPQVLEALQWHENLFQRERILNPRIGGNAMTDFVDGKVAMIGRAYFRQKTDDILPRVQGKFKWEGGIMPRHAKTGKRGGMFAGDAHSVAKATKAPDAAWELLKFLTDREFGVAMGLQSKGSTTLGARADAYGDERIINHPQLSKQMQQAQLAAVKEIREPYTGPANYRAPEVERVRDAEVNKIPTGEVKVESGYLRQVNNLVQGVLDLPRA